jgi:uridine monophosphate synthetase
MKSWVSQKEQAAREVLTLLYRNRMIRTFYRDRPQGWTLVSGLYSPIYIQLRPLASYPEVFEKVCKSVARMIREEAPEVTKIVGIAMAGVPIAAGVALAGGIPAGFTRKMENVKSAEAFHEAITRYGEHSLLEGEFASGDRIALVDDLVTRFDSKQVALEQVTYEINKRGLSDVRCRWVLVVLDREQGGKEAAQAQGVELLSLIPFKSAGLGLLRDVMNPSEWETIDRYLKDPTGFQQKEVQEELARMSPAT